MKQRSVLRVDDICPDGERITIQWDKLTIGASMFIPCLDTTTAQAQLYNVAKQKGIKLKFSKRIEGGLWGLRAWRVK